MAAFSGAKETDKNFIDYSALQAETDTYKVVNNFSQKIGPREIVSFA